MPALCLTYSFIDTLGWAASEKTPQNVGARFEDWVNRWLLPSLREHTTEVCAIDLYAARCAVLHTLTSESDLRAKGKKLDASHMLGRNLSNRAKVSTGSSLSRHR